MDEIAYHIEAAVEPYHWWYVGRKQLIINEIFKQDIDKDAPILDVGTCMGTNLTALHTHSFSNVIGVDNSPLAIAHCKKKGLENVQLVDAKEMPFQSGSFNCVLATDIIEHLADEKPVLDEISRVLSNNGTLIITVPAFNMLWGKSDELAHHHRRYRISKLSRLIESSGYEIQYAYYFNYLLFIPILLTRKLFYYCPIKNKNEFQLGGPMINKFLCKLFQFDIKTSPKIKSPIGVSILLVAKKKRS